MKKKEIILSLLILTSGISVIRAELFTEDFSRANVAQTTDAYEIGNDWNYPPESGPWGITSQVLVAARYQTTRIPAQIYNTGTPLSDTASLTYSVDVYSTNANGYLGMTFNQHSVNNYDIVRFKLKTNTYQVYRSVDGKPESVSGGNNVNMDFKPHRWYTITATTNVGGVAGDVSFTITDRSNGAIINKITNGSLGPRPEKWTNNYFGVFATTEKDSPGFDNFTIVKEESP